MHKLMDYICEELEELERKVDKDGKLSMAEVEYMDKLAHTKKNLLKSEEMWEDGNYSMTDNMSYARGGNRGGRRGANQYGSYAMRGSYARGGRDNYSMGDSTMMIEELRELMEQAPNEHARMEFQKFIKKMEQM